jgi:hypothetical protein
MKRTNARDTAAIVGEKGTRSAAPSAITMMIVYRDINTGREVEVEVEVEALHMIPVTELLTAMRKRKRIAGAAG